MDRQTRDMLVDLAPQNWREAQRRIAAARTYLATNQPTVELAERLAAEIGIRRSMFYRLVSILRDDRPRAGQTSRAAIRIPREDAVEAVVADAIARCGPAATNAEILRTAQALGAERGVGGITQGLVRTRAGRSGAGRSVGARLRVDADYMLDRTGLKIPILGADGAAGRCELTCVVDLRLGVISAHAVTSGEPLQRDVDAVVKHGVPDGARVALPNRDACLRDLAPAAIAQVGPAVVLVRTRRRAGGAIRAALGARLGRVELAERAAIESGEGTAVELSDIRELVAELIRASASESRPEDGDGAERHSQTQVARTS